MKRLEVGKRTANPAVTKPTENPILLLFVMHVKSTGRKRNGRIGSTVIRSEV